MTGRENMSPMRPYWSPYLAGVALGLTLLATYLLMGFGLGASGAFAQVAARLEGAVAPGRAHANPYLVGYLDAGRLWAQWIVVEMVGVIVGAVLGAWTAGRSGVHERRRALRRRRAGAGRLGVPRDVHGRRVRHRVDRAEGVAMSWPLDLEGAGGLAIGLLAGVAFGFILERGGLGEAEGHT